MKTENNASANAQYKRKVCFEFFLTLIQIGVGQSKYKSLW